MLDPYTYHETTIKPTEKYQSQRLDKVLRKYS